MFRSRYRNGWRVGNKYISNGNIWARSPSSLAYLIYDTFSTPVAAPITSPRIAEPGPGTMTVTDANNLLSLAGGSLVHGVGTGADANDPRVTYGAVTRVPGQMGIVSVSGAGNITGTFVGFAADETLRPANQSLYFRTGGTNLSVYLNATLLNVGTYVTSGSYDVVICMRASGVFIFIRGTGYANFELLAWTTSGTQAAQHLSVGGTAATYSVQSIGAPEELFLPTPLLSDGFSGATSDGAGHAETTGIGSGGSGKSWVDSVGSWGVAAGVRRAASLVADVGINTVDVAETDVMYEVAGTRSSGSFGLVVRYVDSSNYVYCLHDGTNITLRKVVAGTDSEVIAATAATYSAGRVIRLGVSGTSFRLYYNLVAIGTEATISDAGLQSGTKIGLITTSVDNTFDNALCYARGSGGEYNSSLMPFFNSSNSRVILAAGDSKTAAGVYQSFLLEKMMMTIGGTWVKTQDYATGGFTLTDLLSYVTSNIVQEELVPSFVLVNIGVNDVISLPEEAVWKADLIALIELFLGKWPNTAIYITRVWRRDRNTECDTIATWIADVISLYSNSVHAGPDERIFLENEDDGTTFTSDGVHPTNPDGYELVADEWLSLLT